MKAVVTSIVACVIALSARAQGNGPCSNQPEVSEIRTYCRDLQANPNSSLAHFRIGEVLLLQRNFQSAANEFRETLSGDLNPKWTEVGSPISLGDIVATTSQQDRAVNEYRLARRTGDDTFGAQEEVAKRLKESDRVAYPYTHAEVFATISSGYTDEARIAELEGTVVLVATVDEAGGVSDVTVLQPLGLGLNENATDAALRWSPSIPSGGNTKTARTRRILAVDFFLNSKSSRWHLVGVTFHSPENASRPEFVSTVYPP